MKNGVGELDVPEVAGASKVGQTTCCATSSGQRLVGDISWHVHILLVTGSECWVIKTADIGAVKFVEEIWVNYLLDRNAADILGGQERERDAGDGGRKRM
jgi:hypothetical protein